MWMLYLSVVVEHESQALSLVVSPPSPVVTNRGYKHPPEFSLKGVWTLGQWGLRVQPLLLCIERMHGRLRGPINTSRMSPARSILLFMCEICLSYDFRNRVTGLGVSAASYWSHSEKPPFSFYIPIIPLLGNRLRKCSLTR